MARMMPYQAINRQLHYVASPEQRASSEFSWSSTTAENGDVQSDNSDSDDARVPVRRIRTLDCVFVQEPYMSNKASIFGLFAAVFILSHFYDWTVMFQPVYWGSEWVASLASNVTEAYPSLGLVAHAVLGSANQVSELASKVWAKGRWFLMPAFSGAALSLFSALILFMDSAVPGRVPPSPCSPSRIKISAKRSLDMNLVTMILNGVALFVVLFLEELRADWP